MVVGGWCRVLQDDHGRALGENMRTGRTSWKALGSTALASHEHEISSSYLDTWEHGGKAICLVSDRCAEATNTPQLHLEIQPTAVHAHLQLRMCGVCPIQLAL